MDSDRAVDNPYQAPNSAPAPLAQVVSPQRRRAVFHWRLGWGLLMIAATDNFCQFTAMVGNPFLTLLNGVGFVLLGILTFCWGLFFFERLTLLLHWMFSGQRSEQRWLDELYCSMRSFSWLAAIGTLIWGTFTACYYYLEVGFFLVSVPAAIAGHLVAACFYLPLFYRWYRLERRAPIAGEA